MAVAVCSGLDGLAHAASFNVPSGPLGDVAASLGVQAGVTIAVTEPDVAVQHSPGVSGNLSLRAALSHILRGTGAEAVFYDRNTIRIIKRRTAAPPRERRRTSSTPPPAPHAIEPLADIIVTASKQNMLLDSYPGSVKIVELDPAWLASHATGGTSAIARLLPMLSSTNLGPGRDKLFIRGIADSSFSGRTQATVGQYLGDVRLNYNAPDPDLNLYDMKRVEVLVGPQGALYGASSLGGVIRLIPNVPNTQALSATASTGVSTTRFGGSGIDGAAMLNFPLVDGQVAARFVAFGGRKAGYIDDPSRGLRDVNSTSSFGQRTTLRVDDLSGWRVDLGFVVQDNTNDDGQYTSRRDPPLSRRSTISQPFHNKYRLGYVTARRMIESAELVSTTSVVHHNLQTVFDATGYDGTTLPARYEEDNEIRLYSHETRISGGNVRAPWVAGVAGHFNASVVSRSLEPVRIPSVTNQQTEAALFGQISHPLTSAFTGTIGARLTFAHSKDFQTDSSIEIFPRMSRSALRFSGALALDWHPGGPVSAFYHYQQGYRAGGLGFALSETGLTGQRFVADDLHMNELGIRIGDTARDQLSVRAAFFIADWRNMQADLISSFGLNYTDNIGHGIIHGLDAEFTLRLSPALALSAAVFVNNSKVIAPEPEFATEDEQTLPNVARAGARLSAAWRQELAFGMTVSSEASLRYVGKSRLGVGPSLDIAQGDYLIGDLGARLDLGKIGLSVDISNVGDVRANSFAFGNPVGLIGRDQLTPLRPRTIRLGVNASF